MATEKTIRLPLEYVEKMLKYLGLRYTKKDLTNGAGSQLCLAEDDYDTVVVTAYNTGSVQVQPHDSLEAEFVRTVFRLRSLRLKQKGKIA